MTTEAGDLLPRSIVHTDLFEIVAILADGQLLVFLDSYSGNTPVVGAELDLTADGEPGPFNEVAPGVYAADWSPSPGTIDLTFLVTAGAHSDLLLATMEIPDPESLPTPLASGFLASASGLSQLLIAFLVGGIASYLLLRYRRSPLPAAEQAEQRASPAVVLDTGHVNAEATTAESEAVPLGTEDPPDRAKDTWAPSLLRTGS